MRVKKQSTKAKRMARKAKENANEKNEAVVGSKLPAKRSYENISKRQYQDDVKQAKRARMSEQYARYCPMTKTCLSRMSMNIG